MKNFEFEIAPLESALARENSLSRFSADRDDSAFALADASRL